MSDSSLPFAEPSFRLGTPCRRWELTPRPVSDFDDTVGSQETDLVMEHPGNGVTRCVVADAADVAGVDVGAENGSESRSPLRRALQLDGERTSSLLGRCSRVEHDAVWEMKPPVV